MESSWRVAESRPSHRAESRCRKDLLETGGMAGDERHPSFPCLTVVVVTEVG